MRVTNLQLCIVAVVIVNFRLSNLNKYFNKISKHIPFVGLGKTEYKLITVFRKSYASKCTNSNVKIKRWVSVSGSPPTQLRFSASPTQLLVGQLTRLPFHSGYATGFGPVSVTSVLCNLYVSFSRVTATAEIRILRYGKAVVYKVGYNNMSLPLT